MRNARQPCLSALAATAVLLAGSACGPTLVGPTLEAVSPNWGYNGQQTPVVISGEHLYPNVEAVDAHTIDLDQNYRAWLLTDPPTELDAVDLLDYRRLNAVVPPGVESGLYGVRVENAAGDRADLGGSFQVTDTLADHLRVTADQISWTVNENAVVAMQVRDLAEAIVPLPLEVRVWASGSAVGGDFAFVKGTLEEQTPDPESGGIRGFLRADGQGYVAFTTPVPGEVVITADPIDPDSLVDPAAQLVSFKAGEVMEVALSLPSDDFGTTAGASFEVGVRLVDSLGNTVTGQSASVLLTETCPGGTLSTFVPFVDEATAVVAATAATDASCPTNTIRAVGVVDGGTVSGVSDGFQVQSSLLDVLEVAAAPASVSAGTGSLSVFVTAVDSWGNRVPSATGGLELSDEEGLLSPEEGNGSQSCEDLVEGVGACTATLYRGGVSRTITVQAEAGASGVSNPIVVLPGPADHLETKVELGVVQAGSPFSVSLQLVDAFDNPIEVDTESLENAQFFDSAGDVDCVLTEVGETTLEYTYSCVCTVAQVDNVLRAVLGTLATTGESTPFNVLAGPLSWVQVDLDPEGTGAPSGELEAGGTLEAEFSAFDAYGNPTTDSETLEMSDTAGGISPEVVELDGGTALVDITLSSALVGNTITVSQDYALLGISRPIDVIAGPAVAYSVKAVAPWAWTGGVTPIQINPVDVHGNLVDSVVDVVTLSSISGLGPDVEIAVAGHTEVEFGFVAAGLDDVLEASGTSLTGMSDTIDVVSDCVEGPPVAVSVVGATMDSLCLGADDLVTADIQVEPEGLHAYHFAIGTSTYRTTLGTTEHTFEGAGRTLVRALGIRSDGCAEESEVTLHHGPVGPAVGPVTVSVAHGSLIAGTTGGDERTRVTLSARTCTGDFAGGADLKVRATIGEVQGAAGTALLGTTEGLQLELDESGEGTVRWTMADVDLGQPGEFFAGSHGGSAFGTADVTVSGDALPPTVITVEPMGAGGGIFGDVTLLFSEPMLTSLSEETLMAAVEVVDPLGMPVEWLTAAWTGDGMELTLVLDAPRETSDGIWTVTVYDELRDDAGNRLDGDLDGDSGGNLTLEFGDIGDAAPSVVECQPTTNIFRPDGDDGPGFEAEQVHLSIATDAPAAWWLAEVTDADDGMVLHRRSVPGGTEAGTISWDGRDQEGLVVSNGLYQFSITPSDEAWNEGEGCVLSVIVDNRLNPQEIR